MRDIISFETACQKKGIPTILPDVSSWPATLRRPILALYKLTVIRDAIVGDWIPDWNNQSQKKWGLWFYLDKPGFRFHESGYGIARAAAAGGPRLCFETEEQAIYAANTFLALWEEWLTIMPAAQEQPETTLEADVNLHYFNMASGGRSMKELALEAALQTATQFPEVRILEEAKAIHQWLTDADHVNSR